MTFPSVNSLNLSLTPVCMHFHITIITPWKSTPVKTVSPWELSHQGINYLKQSNANQPWDCPTAIAGTRSIISQKARITFKSRQSSKHKKLPKPKQTNQRETNRKKTKQGKMLPQIHFYIFVYFIFLWGFVSFFLSLCEKFFRMTPNLFKTHTCDEPGCWHCFIWSITNKRSL